MMTLRLWATGRRCLAVAGLALFGFAVAATTHIDHTEAKPAHEPFAAAPPDADVALDRDDRVRVLVAGHPAFNTSSRVSRAGSIAVAGLGDVPVRGLTARQAAVAVAGELERGGFVRDARVSLIVERHRPAAVSVLGEVRRPGKYALQAADDDRLLVSDLLKQAGGATRHAADYVTLIRNTAQGPIHRRIELASPERAAALTLAEGDVLFVPRAPMFYIQGDARHTGAFRLEGDMTLMRALAVGGVVSGGALRSIEIRRRLESGELHTMRATFTDPLKPGDVVYVRQGA